MRILVSGATGLVGSHLTQLASSTGHESVALTRHPRSESDILWDPDSGQLDARRLEDFDAVVHLAGDNIARGRWTAEKKRRIRDSRVRGTEFLCQTLAALDRRPATLISASAIGYYGDRGNELLTEESAPGTGFLAEVCRSWEQATESAAAAGIRVVNTRIGVVLADSGGALKQMLIPFRLGLGGVVGSGQQYVSWISIVDLCAAILFLLGHESLRHAVNLVAPAPVTNRELTRALGKVLNRPTIVPTPAFVLRIALGEMGEELLLSSTRVVPKRLTEAGYQFQHADIETALRQLLRR